MEKKIIKIKNGIVPIFTNNSKNKKMILFLHGLDGTASFSKPLFKNLDKYKIVAMEIRGHNNSPLPASRCIKKHISDYVQVINYFKDQGYKIWILGESMGGAFGTYISYKYKNLIESVFVQSIPNKLINIIKESKWKKIKINFRTFLCFITNINYKYSSNINYVELSNNKFLQRIARIADDKKIKQTKETLASWAICKTSWRILKKNKLNTKLYFFLPGKDKMTNVVKAKKILDKNNFVETIFLKDAKHILMYEKEFALIVKKIKKVII